ncbi:probable cytochrome P450 9f2 [Topomyia yanbarensis]|uniref:probable cytochrome P450 9f2 n=1 Tax=Topomyia yanbarensis TaxID=2498891 RepID=UPI00273B49EE|nr:probable cytochrome P450 9f2 [Topomyia yanbarensis]
MEVNVIYLTIMVVILILIFRWLTKNHDYFHEKPIPSLGAWPVFGSTGDVMLYRCTFTDYVKQVYDKFASVKVFGLFDTNTRVFVIRDPELIKQIAVKDFDHFVDRRPVFGKSTGDNPNVLFNKAIVMMTGRKWRDMRATLSPAFTGSKMRAMFGLITEYSDRMIQILRTEADNGRGYVEYDMKNLFSRISTDIIATCAFGIEVESVKDTGNEFYVMGKAMLNFLRTSVMLRMLGYTLFPGVMQTLGIDVIDRQQIRYFSNMVRETVKNREVHGIVRPDMIHLLMLEKKGALKYQQETVKTVEGFATVEESSVGRASVTKTLTNAEITAQCMIFFLAGFEAISSAMVFMAYQLALSSTIQLNLYEEILETNKRLNGQALSYDILQAMKYMDMVVSETLRLWTNPMSDRLCVKDYHLDDGQGLRFTIDKGTCVWFPIYGIHHDPKYYPNPEKFDPERFNDANRANINMSTYLPFGIGPRNCIGSRFALMEIKAIMYQLLLNFSIERTEQTQVPLQIGKGLLPSITTHLRLRLRL